MAVFISLPFVAFAVGRFYQNRLDLHQESRPTVSSQTTPTVTPADHLPAHGFTKLIISQMNEFHPETITFTKVITNSEAIDKLYLDIQQLPVWRVKKGDIFNCPEGDGIEYSLDFYTDNTLYLHARYHPTGCANMAFNNQYRLPNDTIRTDIDQLLKSQ